MKKIFCGVYFIIISFFCANCVYAQHSLTDDVHVSVIIAEHPAANWEISIKDSGYPDGQDITDIDTSGIQMHAMGQRRLVLGKVYLKLHVYDLYEVVVYTNSMDINNDGIPDTPWYWNQRGSFIQQDFVDHHAGLQNLNPRYLDNEGFNSLLYGAALKIRSQGIHGSAFSLPVNATVPDQLWDAGMYPDQVQFTYVPELASESLLGNPPLRVAGSIYQSSIICLDGTPNWLEMVFATSEENVGSDEYATDIYFDLRWN